MHTLWFWFVMGFLPYAIKRHQTKDEQIFSVRALFWRLTIRWRQERCSWEIYIPLIEHLRQE
jgi:hypothetical protein